MKPAVELDGVGVAISPAVAPIATTRVLGVPIAHLDEAAAIAEIERLADHEPPAHVVYVNAHTLNLAHRSPGYRAVLLRAALVLRDGVGVGLAGWAQHRPFPANLNGTDFTPYILRLATRRRWSVFMLGGLPGVADTAASRLEVTIPGLIVAGTAHGYLAPDEASMLIERIRKSAPDVLLVAMGNPLQEQWLDRHLPASGARLGIGVGAFFDFVVNRVPRAPTWVRRARLEWLYRLGQEPRRLAHRYLVGNPAFLLRVALAHCAGRRALPPGAEPDAS